MRPEREPEALKTLHTPLKELSHQLLFSPQPLDLDHQEVILRYFQVKWAASIAIRAYTYAAETWKCCVAVTIRCKVLQSVKSAHVLVIMK